MPCCHPAALLLEYIDICCRVVAWEPVPQFRALLSLNLARNGLTHLVTVRPTVVAHPPGSKQVRFVWRGGATGLISVLVK
jgi:hypothetical protein